MISQNIIDFYKDFESQISSHPDDENGILQTIEHYSIQYEDTEIRHLDREMFSSVLKIAEKTIPYFDQSLYLMEREAVAELYLDYIQPEV